MKLNKNKKDLNNLNVFFNTIKEYYKSKSNKKKVAYILKSKPSEVIKNIENIKKSNFDLIVSEYFPTNIIISHDKYFMDLLIEKGELLQNITNSENTKHAIFETNKKLNVVITKNMQHINFSKKKVINSKQVIFFNTNNSNFNDHLVNICSEVLYYGNLSVNECFLKLISHKWSFCNDDGSVRNKCKALVNIFRTNEKVLPSTFKNVFFTGKSDYVISKIVSNKKIRDTDLYSCLIKNTITGYLESYFYNRIELFTLYMIYNNSFKELLIVIRNKNSYCNKVCFFIRYFINTRKDFYNKEIENSFNLFYSEFRKLFNEKPPLLNHLKEKLVEYKKDQNNWITKRTLGANIFEIDNIQKFKLYFNYNNIDLSHFISQNIKMSKNLLEILEIAYDLSKNSNKSNPFFENFCYIVNSSGVYEKYLIHQNYYLYNFIHKKDFFIKKNESDIYFFNTLLSQEINLKDSPLKFILKTVYLFYTKNKEFHSINNESDYVYDLFFDGLSHKENIIPFSSFRDNPCICAYLILYFEVYNQSTYKNSIINLYEHLSYDYEAINYFLN